MIDLFWMFASLYFFMGFIVLWALAILWLVYKAVGHLSKEE